MTAPRLAPTPGPLYVVRWVRLDCRDAKHHYYRRLHDAQAFKARLIAAGREARIFRTQTKWQQES